VVALLRDKEVKFSIVEYLKERLTRKEILTLSKKLNKRPIEFIRKQDVEIKKNFQDLKSLSNDEAVELIIKFPKIMERPIVVFGEKAIIGRPPENVLSLFD
jgi:arsenate reductase